MSPPRTTAAIRAGAFWLKFLVLAAYEPQLSKELLVPVDTLGDPRDNGSADKNDL